jgi:hypothetical protein
MLHVSVGSLTSEACRLRVHAPWALSIFDVVEDRRDARPYARATMIHHFSVPWTTHVW